MVFEAEPVKRYPVLNDGRQQYILFSYIRVNPEESSSVLEGNREFMDSLDPTQIQRLPNLIRDSRTIKAVPVLTNSALVVSIAKKMVTNGWTGSLTLGDMVQYGQIGVMRAVKQFDHNRGIKFSTFATRGARDEMIRAIQQYGFQVRPPYHISQILGRVNRARGAIMTETMVEEPTVEMIAQRCKLPEGRVKDALCVLANSPVSLDSPIYKENGTGDVLGVFIEDSRQGIDQSLTRREGTTEDIVSTAMKDSGLDDRQKRVIILRFLRPKPNGEKNMTLEEVSRELEITRERARQIEEKALQRMKEFLNSRGVVLSDIIDS